MSSGPEVSSILLYILNIGVFLIGTLMGATVRRFSASGDVSPLRWGTSCLVILNVALLGLVISHLSNMPSQVTTDGVQQFNNGVSLGAMVGTVIFPGLVILCMIWLYIRIKAGRIVQQVESANDIGASRIISTGNKVATVIFWIFGGGFLLFLLGALIFGR